MGVALVEKEIFYGVVQPTLSYDIFGMKEILGWSTISLVLLILFGLLCIIWPLGVVQTTVSYSC